MSDDDEDKSSIDEYIEQQNERDDQESMSPDEDSDKDVDWDTPLD